MRTQLLIAAFILVPTTAWGQNVSTVVQAGMDNVQITQQAGRNFAATVQLGSGNGAVTGQDGVGNISAIVQIGEDHAQNHSQTDDHQGLGSVQVSSDHYSGSFSVTGGNAQSMVTLHVEVD